MTGYIIPNGCVVAGVATVIKPRERLAGEFRNRLYETIIFRCVMMIIIANCCWNASSATGQATGLSASPMQSGEVHPVAV